MGIRESADRYSTSATIPGVLMILVRGWIGRRQAAPSGSPRTAVAIAEDGGQIRLGQFVTDSWLEIEIGRLIEKSVAVVADEPADLFGAPVASQAEVAFPWFPLDGPGIHFGGRGQCCERGVEALVDLAMEVMGGQSVRGSPRSQQARPQARSGRIQKVATRDS